MKLGVKYDTFEIYFTFLLSQAQHSLLLYIYCHITLQIIQSCIYLWLCKPSGHQAFSFEEDQTSEICEDGFLR